MKESFSAKHRRQRCCLAERCLQGILPAHTLPRPGACASKKGRERARTSSGFSLRNRSSPQFLRWQLVPPSSSVHVSNGQATRVRVRATAFSSPATLPNNSHIVQPRRQPGDGLAEETTRRRFSRGDNQETVQPRRQPGDGSAEETTRRRFSRETARDTDEKNRRDDLLLSRAQRKATRVGDGKSRDR